MNRYRVTLLVPVDERMLAEHLGDIGGTGTVGPPRDPDPCKWDGSDFVVAAEAGVDIIDPEEIELVSVNKIKDGDDD